MSEIKSADLDGNSSSSVIPKKYLFPFILVTSLFALWGFANDITNPLVAVFKDVFVIDNAQSTWVQMAFYGGYATMALPAAIFIRKFSYKSGIIVGLLLYATGAFLSIPAASGANFNLFIVALYVLTFGLAFLETTANPYILSMGPPETATRRLNLAQAFNPIGSLTGMFIAGTVILSTIQVEDFKNDVAGYQAELQPAQVEEKQEHYILPFLKSKSRERVNDANVKSYVASLGEGDKDANALQDYKDGKIESFMGMTHSELQKRDLKIVSMPYMIIGFVVVGVMLIFLLTKMPDTNVQDEDGEESSLGASAGRLFSNPRYIGGVIAQTFYVGAQIMCWTFIIQYAENLLGIDKATAQNHNIMAMVIFLCSRFICTFFLKYISPGRLLAILSIAALACTLGAIHLQGMAGLYSLIGISAFMSLMFPTIYGLALDGVGSDAKLGSAGLIFAIVGGAFMPWMQGSILDLESFMGTSPSRGSFYLPALCFVVITIYGFMCWNRAVPKSKVAAS